MQIAAPRIELDITGLDLEKIKGDKRPFTDSQISQIIKIGHHQFFEMIQENQHYKVDPNKVIQAIDQAFEEKDMQTIEFLLKTISHDAVPLLFGDCDFWDSPTFSGRAMLDRTLFLDKIMTLLKH